MPVCVLPGVSTYPHLCVYYTRLSCLLHPLSAGLLHAELMAPLPVLQVLYLKNRKDYSNDFIGLLGESRQQIRIKHLEQFLTE